MTHRVKQFIAHKCNVCRWYECDQDKRWDASQFEDDDVHYCTELRRYINGGTIGQCDNEHSFEEKDYY